MSTRQISLKESERGMFRMMAEAASATLTNDQRKEIARSVETSLAMLRAITPDDDIAALVGAAMSKLLALIAMTRVQDISERLDTNVAVYSLSAGILAGQYTLPGVDVTAGTAQHAGAGTERAAAAGPYL